MRRAGHVTEPKLILLTAQQANKLGEKVLEQGTMILIGKLADQEDGRLATQSIFSQTQLGLLLYTRGVVGAHCNAAQWLFGTAAPPAPALLQLYYFIAISALQRMKPVYGHNILNALHRLWSGS